MRLFYFSYKQVKHDFSLLRSNAIISGRFNITVNWDYNAFNVYCRELAPGTVSLTGDRAQGDDSKHWANYIFESTIRPGILLCTQTYVARLLRVGPIKKSYRICARSVGGFCARLVTWKEIICAQLMISHVYACVMCVISFGILKGGAPKW